MTMADGASAATSEFAKAAVSVGGFTKNIQAGALYVKLQQGIRPVF